MKKCNNYANDHLLSHVCQNLKILLKFCCSRIFTTLILLPFKGSRIFENNILILLKGSRIFLKIQYSFKKFLFFWTIGGRQPSLEDFLH